MDLTVENGKTATWGIVGYALFGVKGAAIGALLGRVADNLDKINQEVEELGTGAYTNYMEQTKTSGAGKHKTSRGGSRGSGYTDVMDDIAGTADETLVPAIEVTATSLEYLDEGFLDSQEAARSFTGTLEAAAESIAAAAEVATQSTGTTTPTTTTKHHHLLRPGAIPRILSWDLAG